MVKRWRRVPMASTNWDKLSEDERREITERHRSGEYIRHKLIRFGYLSLAERRRLIETYGDLDERFERGLNYETRLQIAVLVFFVYLAGIMIGTGLAEPGWVALLGLVIAIIIYWALVFWYLNESDKAEKE